MSQAAPDTYPSSSTEIAAAGATPLALSLLARRAHFSLSQWYLDKHDQAEIERMVERDVWGSESRQSRETFNLLDEDLVQVWERFQALSEYERETIDDLRDKEVSIPDLIDYIRGESGFNPDNKPVRTDIASTLRKREFLAKSKRIEDSGRSAALAIGAVGMIAIGSWVITSGLFPDAAAAAGSITKWVKPAWEIASDLVQTAAGGGAMLLAWKGWKEFQQIKSGVPRLELGRDADFSDLPVSLGKINYGRLNDQYESIPSADRHLIKHLSATELRMFLTGGDSTRLHILRANPPAPWAKVQSRLDKAASGQGPWIKQMAMAAWTVISAPWHRDHNNARIPDLEERMQNWRDFARITREHRKGRLENPEQIQVLPIPGSP